MRSDVEALSGVAIETMCTLRFVQVSYDVRVCRGLFFFFFKQKTAYEI